MSQALFRSSGSSHDIVFREAPSSPCAAGRETALWLSHRHSFISQRMGGRHHRCHRKSSMAFALQNLQPYHVWNLVCLHMYDKAALEHELNCGADYRLMTWAKSSSSEGLECFLWLLHIPFTSQRDRQGAEELLCGCQWQKTNFHQTL